MRKALTVLAVIIIGVIGFKSYKLAKISLRQSLARLQDSRLKLEPWGNVTPIKVYIATASLSPAGRDKIVIAQQRLETPNLARGFDPLETIRTRLNDNLRTQIRESETSAYFIKDTKIYSFDKNTRILNSADVPVIQFQSEHDPKVIAAHTDEVIIGSEYRQSGLYSPIIAYDSRTLKPKRELLRVPCNQKFGCYVGYWFIGSHVGKDYFQSGTGSTQTITKTYNPATHSLTELTSLGELKAGVQYGIINTSSGTIIFPYNCAYEAPCPSEYVLDLNIGKLTDYPQTKSQSQYEIALRSKISPDFKYVDVSVEELPVSITDETEGAAVVDTNRNKIRLTGYGFGFGWSIQKIRKFDHDNLILELVTEDSARVSLFNIKTGEAHYLDRNRATSLVWSNPPFIFTESSGLYRLYNLHTKKVIGQFAAHQPSYGPNLRAAVDQEIRKRNYWTQIGTREQVLANYSIRLDENTISCSRTQCSFQTIASSNFLDIDSHKPFPEILLDTKWKFSGSLSIISSQLQSYSK